MKQDNFAWICKHLFETTGLVLGPDKLYLVESRLSPVARKYNAADLDALTDALRAGRNTELMRDVTDAMMTNESFFFRDGKPFEQFKQIVLPKLMQARAAQKTIRIWSAACSTGQEPYTLAMILKEEGAKLAGWRIEIVGTDLSREALERAKQGAYSQFEVQRGLPITLLVKYFTQSGDRWMISPELKNNISFKELNLLSDFTTLGTFDVVFCRNVLIYFDQTTKAKILEKISRMMPADGVLYLGGAETVLGVTEKFAPMPNQRGIYVHAAQAAVEQRRAVGA
ncbi:MAG TPA: protein-glutamate O-methyltransferase [Alphaproteobacteria bacterium]|nr:protein-glutamate O-methyltransferase [Alphaproteobacteria bacterium]